MFTIATYPYPECALGKCKKSQHGYRIVEAITRSRSSDDLLVRFVAKACRNFARVTDAGVFIIKQEILFNYHIFSWVIRNLQAYSIS